jgi:hypothetical protein
MSILTGRRAIAATLDLAKAHFHLGDALSL